MKRIIRIGAILLVVGSWLSLCDIGMNAPTFVRRPLSTAIENMRKTNLASDAGEAWAAVRPVTDFTKSMSDQILLFSSLMFVGFIVFATGMRKE